MKRILLTLLVAGGLMSAQATIYQYNISFAPEALGATGTGTGAVYYNNVSQSLQMFADFSGLSGNVTVTHIHAPTALPGVSTAGVALGNPSLPGFPLGGTSGSYSNTINLTLAGSWNNTFLSNNGGTPAGAEAAFFTAMNDGKAYWNIHSSTFTGGEIRGFLTLVPEPSSAALVVLGIAGVVLGRRKNRRSQES
jgi:hypothetical protein